MRTARNARLTLAGLAAAALSLGAGAVTPAVAGGDHGDHGEDAVVIGLTERTVDKLTAGRNVVRAVGAADKDVHDGAVHLSLPVRGEGRERRAGGDRDVLRLAGALAITGSGPDASWSRLRVNLDRGVITAVVNGGARASVLKVDHDERGGHHRRSGGYGVELDLTRAGAASLNRAVVGTPFEAGDTFAGDSDGCR